MAKAVKRVTKRGAPIAKVVPFVAAEHWLRGSVLSEGDLLSPIHERCDGSR